MYLHLTSLEETCPSVKLKPQLPKLSLGIVRGSSPSVLRIALKLETNVASYSSKTARVNPLLE
jgi:hypothetical protein